MALLTRADLLAAVALPRETVRVPELGGEVLIQGMSGTQRDAWEASLVEGRGKRRKMNTANIRAKLVAQCCVDGSGVRLFTDADMDILGETRVDVLNRLFNVAQRLSGVSDDDVDELGIASGSTTDAPSTSPSPSSLGRPSENS
jgi:hypothetical protein